MLAHRCTKERLALISDAAHGILPIAGTRYDLGFHDAIALSNYVITPRTALAPIPFRLPC